MTTSSQPDPAGSGGLSGSWRRWNVSERTAVVGTAISIVGVLVSVLTWLWPTEPAADATPPPPPSPTVGTSQPSGPTPGQSGGTATSAPPPSASAAEPADYLVDVPAQIGRDKLVEIPLPVRERAEYNDHAIAIRCPSNASKEPATEVTYQLSGHYRQFNATVHPYYPPGSDARSATWVTVIRSDVQRDGSFTTSAAGEQKRARPGAPGSLTAAVEKADKLTLRVECGDPGGVVMLTDARLTPA
nr:hypothetical protein [Micromonospora sp.]